MFEPDFSKLKTSLKEKYKGDTPEDPIDELLSANYSHAIDAMERVVLEYHKQLWEELKRQGVVK